MRALCKGGKWGGCGRWFGGERDFDRHRVGEFAGTGGTNTRRCMSEAELRANGYRISDAKQVGDEVVWTRSKPFSAQPFSRERTRAVEREQRDTSSQL